MKKLIISFLALFFFLSLTGCSQKSSVDSETKTEAESLVEDSNRSIKLEIENEKKDIDSKEYEIRGATYQLKDSNDKKFLCFLYYTDKIVFEGTNKIPANPRSSSYTYNKSGKLSGLTERKALSRYYSQIKDNKLKPIISQNDFDLDHFLQAVEEPK